MDKSLTTLCGALKQIFAQLKPQLHPISFLILTGRNNQGKSTLMRQSNFDHHPIDADGAHIYFNQQGVIVELGETWINQSEQLLEDTLKYLNRVHRSVKINGILLCVDINEILTANHGELKAVLTAHVKLLERFGLCLNYQLDAAVILTKLDLLAGFCDFFQSEHPLELAKPMGFSIYDSSKPHKTAEQFKTKFDQLVEQLGQQVTHKIHPIRSNVKRTLIRELPLQIASLRNIIYPLISSISSTLFRLQALYFTSAEQGGIIQDRLNKKIQHEFALVIQDEFYQSTNYRAYFIEGALFAFQAETQRHAPKNNPKHVRLTIGLSTASILAMSWLGYQYLTSLSILNHVKHELQMVHQLKDNDHSNASTYHLAQASTTLNSLSSGSLNLSMIKTLKTNLKQHTNDKLTQEFIPQILHELEEALLNAHESQIARYQALKIYLMLARHKHDEPAQITAWFTQHWQSNPKDVSKKLALLKQVLNDKTLNITLNPQVVSDTRNYLNALPASYLFYSIAKTQFSAKTLPMNIPGFDLSQSAIPIYMTQSGFQKNLAELDNIIKQLTVNNWILERQDLDTLPALLQEAYCEDYVMWWKHFLHNSHPIHTEDYRHASQLSKTLRQSNSFAKLIQLIQTNTRPHIGPNASLFNRHIADKFSDLNLLSPSNMTQLNKTLSELSRFSNTLSLVSDNGKTAFYLTKARFEGDKLSNPISELYNQAEQFPEPLSTWTNQIADDTWFTLINNSRTYINQEWQQLVFTPYQTHIAHRYPLDSKQSKEISLTDFNRFFATHGSLNQFLDTYIKPFLETKQAQWQRKEQNHYVMPISDDTINEFIRANVITHMFFPDNQDISHIAFSLQKITLDPVVSQLQLTLGNTNLSDTQTSDSFVEFQWPQANASLLLRAIDGKQFSLEEQGTWAFFKLLQKVNILVDEQDSRNLQILFEINGNSGRYLLKAQNQINPFIPGILDEFTLMNTIV